MSKVFGPAGRLVVAAGLVAASFLAAGRGGASASSPHPTSVLPRSPLSTGVLVAQALHSHKLTLPGNGVFGKSTLFGNVQASEGGYPVNEDPIAINPNSNAQLLTGGNDYNCPNLQGFYTSSNGGTTWNTHCMDALSGASGDGDPGVGYDLNNNAYITGIDAGTTPDGTDIVFQKSSNNGGTWSAPAVAAPPLFPGGFTDKPWLQIDTTPTSPYANALYVSVTQFDATFSNIAISVSHSNDGGATWTETQVDSTQSFPYVDQFSDIATDRNGNVYVSWMRCLAGGFTGDCGGTTAAMLISESSDGGNTWSSPRLIGYVNLAPDSCFCAFYGSLPNTFERVSDIPVIAVDNSDDLNDPHAGSIFATTYNWNGTNMQVQVTWSSDGGYTWSSPTALAPANNKHDQFLPWLSINAKGAVGVTWEDRRNDPNNVNYQGFASIAGNGGTTFSPNFPMTRVLSNPYNDGFGSLFMGDYTGNAWASLSNLVMSGPDMRNGIDAQDWVYAIKLPTSP